MRKFLLTFTTVLFLVSSGFVTTSISQETNLTAEEALDIAMADPKVAEWLMTDEFQAEEPYISNNTMWIVVFTLVNDPRKELVVYVDDVTGEVMEVLFYDVDDVPTYYDEYVDEAIIFVQELELLSIFLQNNPYLNWNGWKYNDIVDINAYSDDYENYVYLSIQLNITVTDGIPTFSLTHIHSNGFFGSPIHDFDEIVTLISEHEEVVEFVSLHPEYSTNLNLQYKGDMGEYIYEIYYYPEYNETYYGRDYAEAEDLSLNSFCFCGGGGWLQLIVDDRTGEVLETHGSYTSIHTMDEITRVMENHGEIGSWLDTLEDYEIYANYDGYSMWWINIWSTTTQDYSYLSVNDTTLEIFDYYIFIPIPASKTEAEVEALILANNEIANWVREVGNYNTFVYYDSQGNWYVNLHDVVLYQNYASARLDDKTGMVYDVYTHIINTNLSVEEIYGILREADLEEFFNDFPDAVVHMYYSGEYRYDDFYEKYDNATTVTSPSGTEPGWNPEPAENGRWNIYVYSPTIVEARIEIVIDDETGKTVSRFEERPAVMPKNRVSDVMNIVNSLEEVNDFKINHTITYEYIYYYDKTWYVWLNGEDNRGYYSYVSALIDDADLEVLDIEIFEYSWGIRGGVYEDLAVAEGPTDASIHGLNTDAGVPLGDILSEPDGPTLSVPGFAVYLAILSIFTVVFSRKRIKMKN
ncbi:MAG: hypothetical protein ACXAD7_08860 [Candidatus Kariarchaeaceae archaeon]|jgi:hypothetical protein